MKKRLKLVRNMVRGGLLNNHEADVALKILSCKKNDELLATDPSSVFYFTNKELFAIYTCVKGNMNHAPEENKKFEIKTADKIFEKIENFIN